MCFGSRQRTCSSREQNKHAACLILDSVRLSYSDIIKPNSRKVNPGFLRLSPFLSQQQLPLSTPYCDRYQISTQKTPKGHTALERLCVGKPAGHQPFRSKIHRNDILTLILRMSNIKSPH